MAANVPRQRPKGLKKAPAPPAPPRKKTHIVYVQYEGHDYDYDRKIERVAGRDSDGSGFCFFDGQRDMDFFFYQEKAAKNAAGRIRRQCRRMKTKVEVRSIYDDCGCSIEDCECHKE